MLVDTIGLVLCAIVHAADIQDRDGAKQVLEKIKDELPRLSLIWADGGYTGQLIDWTSQVCNWTLEIVNKDDKAKGFQVLPRRWVVERTFGWLMRYRRLCREYEYYTDTSENLIYLAMINIMVRRLARRHAS